MDRAIRGVIACERMQVEAEIGKFSIVVPAQAGTRSAAARNFQAMATSYQPLPARAAEAWTPACAGVTSEQAGIYSRAPMMQWLRYRRYRKAVRTDFDWMLSGFPREFSERIWRTYPGIEGVVSSDFSKGTNPPLVALQIISATITDFIERWEDGSAKARVLAQLREAKDTPPEDAFAKGILRMESVAHQWALAGKFEMQFRDILVSEVIGALAGKTYNERASDRIAGAFLKHSNGS